MTYTLYGHPRSRAFRVLWLLEELHAAYDLVPVQPQSDALRAVSPAGKAPVLAVDDTILTDSSAILTWLADRHHAFTHPAGSLDRARQDAWTFRILDEIDSVLWTAARHSFVLPPDQRVDSVKPSLKAEYARNVTRIGDDLDGAFLMGTDMTVPDILLGHCLLWADAAEFPAPPKALAAYLDRARARDGFQRAAAQR